MTEEEREDLAFLLNAIHDAEEDTDVDYLPLGKVRG